MNTNDLPPAAKLAALIEAGVAANPDLSQGKVFPLMGDRACALGFACLASGMPRGLVEKIGTDEAYMSLGLSMFAAERIWKANDRGDSLAEICASLREGELAQADATAEATK
jgi:hypothetical protein